MVLDTNIIIAYLKGEDNVVTTINNWRQENRALFISSISFSEVLSLPNLTPTESEKIKTFLSSFISIALDNQLGEAAALLRRLYRLSLPDAAIAATALTRGVPLVTRDQKFKKVKEVITVEI